MQVSDTAAPVKFQKGKEDEVYYNYARFDNDLWHGTYRICFWK